MRQRLRIRQLGFKWYEPEWKGAVEGFVVNIINANLWRVARMMEFDDLYQEAYCLFLKLWGHYHGVVNNDRWFMALYKVSLNNLITRLSNQSTSLGRQVRLSDMAVLGEEEDEPTDVEFTGELDGEGFLAVLLEQAPDEVKQVLSILLGAPAELLNVVAESWTDRGKRKLEGNQLLCILAGQNPRHVDLVAAIRQALEVE